MYNSTNSNQDTNIGWVIQTSSVPYTVTDNLSATSVYNSQCLHISVNANVEY